MTSDSNAKRPGCPKPEGAAAANQTGDFDSTISNNVSPSAMAQEPCPRRIGRYRVEKTLGKGSFGQVFLAYDEELQRFVAIKIPHRGLVAGPDDVKAYLTEARVLASLDHPNIVPVHDAGATDDGLCFVVSKFIPRRDLTKKAKDN